MKEEHFAMNRAKNYSHQVQEIAIYGAQAHYEFFRFGFLFS